MLMGENAVAGLLKVADAYAAHAGWKTSTLSTRAASDNADMFARLKRGRNSIMARKIDEVMCVIAHNWPAELPWPADVPRPTAAEVRRVLGRPTVRGVYPPRTIRPEARP